MIRGRRYERAKKREGRPNKQGNSCTVSGPTAEKIAKEHGVSPRTVKNDATFAKAVEKVKAVDPDIESKVIAGTAPTKKAITEAARPSCRGRSLHAHPRAERRERARKAGQTGGKGRPKDDSLDTTPTRKLSDRSTRSSAKAAKATHPASDPDL